MEKYSAIYYGENKEYSVFHYTHKNRKLNTWRVYIRESYAGHNSIELSEREVRLALKTINDAKRGKLFKEEK